MMFLIDFFNVMQYVSPASLYDLQIRRPMANRGKELMKSTLR